MKKVAAIFLASLVGLTSSSSLFIWLTFEVAQPYVEKMWCINKERPEKQCHGKCFLHQQLQEQQEDDASKKAPLNVEDVLKLTVFFVQTDPNTTLPLLKKQSMIFGYLVPISQIFPFEIFHPPCLLSC